MSIWADEGGDAGAPLIALVHGSMDRSSGVLRLSRRLDRRFRVLRYDRRGYGRSSDVDTSFTMEDQVADLVALLGGRRAVIVGHSYGGNVALATAERHPHLVAAVAVYETPLSWEPWWPGATAGAAARDPDASPEDAAERFMRRMVGDALWESLPERTRAARRAEGPALVGELRDLASIRPWSPEAIRCPVVVAYGTQGAEHHRIGMRTVHGWLPGSVLQILDGCRHDAPHGAADVFAAEVVERAAALAGPPWSTTLA